MTAPISRASPSASFGQDDDYEAALRYNRELGGFKIALGTGYSVNTDEIIQAADRAARTQRALRRRTRRLPLYRHRRPDLFLTAAGEGCPLCSTPAYTTIPQEHPAA